MAFGRESSEQIRKIVKEVTGEYAAVPIPVVPSPSKSHSIRFSTGFSIVHLVILAAGAGAVLWKLDDVASKQDRNFARMEERVRTLEDFKVRVETEAAAAAKRGAGRGGR